MLGVLALLLTVIHTPSLCQGYVLHSRPIAKAIVGSSELNRILAAIPPYPARSYSIKTSFRWSKTEKSLTSKVLDVKGEKMFCLCLGVKIQSTCPGGQCVVPEVLEGEERTKGFG